MRDLITFYLSIRYRAPSREELFLDENWGVRDVSGPYLSSLVGFIYIDNKMFSSKAPSTITLVLSVSNRCPTDSVLTKVSTPTESFSEHVKRNGSKEFIIGSVYAGLQEKYVISVSLPDVRTTKDVESFGDILAIDELCIER